MSIGHVIVVDPAVTRDGGPPAVAAAQTLKRIVFGARANAEARRQFAPRYLTNSLRNAAAIATGRDVRELADAYRGVPAVIAAAGPSLDRVIDGLRGVASRALLISADTALRPLLTAGVDRRTSSSDWIRARSTRGTFMRCPTAPRHGW